MQALERMVSVTVEKEGLCTVPMEELRRVWPQDQTRRLEIARFAEKRGLIFFSYSETHGATFFRRKSEPK